MVFSSTTFPFLLLTLIAYLASYNKIMIKNSILLFANLFFDSVRAKSPDFPIIDLQNDPLKAKNNSEKDLHLKTNNHWNGLGISTAYSQLKKSIEGYYHYKLDKTKIKIEQLQFSGGDLTEMPEISVNYINHKIKNRAKKIPLDNIDNYESCSNIRSKNRKSVHVQHDSSLS